MATLTVLDATTPKANLAHVIALLNSWRDVSRWAKGQLIADWKASGYLTAEDATEALRQTGATP